MRRTPAILDVEASGLGLDSDPVEAGIAVLGADVSWLALIRPEPEWLDGEWDEVAAELHGLTRTEILKSGRPADQGARELWARIGDGRIDSDAPEQDGLWLERLRGCAWPPLPPISLRHVAELLPGPVARDVLRDGVPFARPDRAGQDAERLAAVVARCTEAGTRRWCRL